MNDLDIEKGGSPKARAIRIKKLRHMLGVTTIGLADLLQYTRQTVSFWENADQRGGLSEKGALKLAEVAKEKGIYCDPQWLLFGIGELKMMPSTSKASENLKIEHNGAIERPDWIQSTINKLQAHLKFFKEVESFLQDDPTAVIAEIDNTYMEPLYKKGDWVGGHLITMTEHLVGEICIVEVNKTTQVRMIQAGDTKEVFNAIFLRKTNEISPDIELKNISISHAAPILRLWRKTT